MRRTIESDGVVKRWEFDRRRLFDRTSYMVKVCADLRSCIVGLQQFEVFLRADIRAVTQSVGSVEQIASESSQLQVGLFCRR